MSNASGQVYALDDPLAFEVWVPAAGYVGCYEVSSLGRVRRVKAGPGCVLGRVLKPTLRKDREWRYRQVHLSNENVKANAYIHRIVCEAFNGPPPFHGAHARHLDGDSLNNCADNLAWGTASDNERDKLLHGKHRFGKTHCVNGHEFNEANSYLRKGSNARACRPCKRESNRQSRARAA